MKLDYKTFEHPLRAEARSPAEVLEAIRSRAQEVSQHRPVSVRRASRWEPTWQVGMEPNVVPYPSTRALKRHQDWLLENPQPQWPDMDPIARLCAALDCGATAAMIGKRGTGKTQIATWIMNGWPQRACYFRAVDLFSMIKSWLSINSGCMQHNMRLLDTCPLLVLDEMHEATDGASDFEQKQLVRLIDARYGARLPTLMISNLTRESFKKHVGASIWSRLQEGGVCEEMNWESYRKPRGSEMKA